MSPGRASLRYFLFFEQLGSHTREMSWVEHEFTWAGIIKTINQAGDGAGSEKSGGDGKRHQTFKDAASYL